MKMYRMFDLIAIYFLDHDLLAPLELTIGACFGLYLYLNSFKDDMHLGQRFQRLN